MIKTRLPVPIITFDVSRFEMVYFFKSDDGVPYALLPKYNKVLINYQTKLIKLAKSFL